jgi:hypothetical protein
LGGKGDRLVEQFEVAQPGRYGKDVHLPAGVIDVILARHLVAGKGQQRAQAGAVGGAAAMADMQRAGGIGGNEFDLQAAGHASVLRRAATEIIARRPAPRPPPRCAPRRQREIDEAGAGDLDLRDKRRGRQLAHHALGDLARIGLQFARQLHPQVAGEITVAGLLGALENDVGKPLGGGDAGKRGAQQAGEMLTCVEGVCRGCAGCGHVGNTRGFLRVVNYTSPVLLAAAVSGFAGGGLGPHSYRRFRVPIPCAFSACSASPASPIRHGLDRLILDHELQQGFGARLLSAAQA